MYIAATAKFLLFGVLPGSGLSIPLPINPIKFILFVGWLYGCLYCVNYIQYSGLVSKKFLRITASALSIFAGPVIIFVLMLVNILRKATEGRHSITDVVNEKISRLKSINFAKLKRKSSITLLDISGRNLDEIYNSGKSSILNLTKQIIANALDDRSSDILIDPRDSSSYTVRYRVDGVLREVYQLDAEVCKAVINSIKAIANMDIAERRRPQDGSFTAERQSSVTAFRVASAGVHNGEKLAIRMLNQDVSMFALGKVGLTTKQRQIVEAAIEKPSGMILICGPTGSGKTTTLYAMMNEIDRLSRNVITIEDPIEYVLPNASQIEVNPKADITFAKSLRSILRQDPDIICVGEIRDEETARIALQAAQTGHLVLATVHSNSNAATLVRLFDLKVSPLLIASGLNLIISQRLVRQLCTNCRAPAELSTSQIEKFHRQKINCSNFQQTVGCQRCNSTGYYGRIAIYDMLILDSKLKAAIANNKLLIDQLQKSGDMRGKSNLQKQGLKLVTSGVTSFEELKRVVG